MLRSIISLILAPLTLLPSEADAADSFVARCTQTGGSRYDHAIDMNGTPFEMNGWNHDEKLFVSPVIIEYSAEEQKVIVDSGDPLRVIYEDDESIVFVRVGEGLFAFNLVSYALDLSMGQMIYSQVQRKAGLANGLMVRSFSLECKVSVLAR